MLLSNLNSTLALDFLSAFEFGQINTPCIIAIIVALLLSLSLFVLYDSI